MKKALMKIGMMALGLTLVNSVQASTLYLGTVSLMDRTDRDTLILPPCHRSANRPVESLKLAVSQFDAEIDKLVVEYQNGETDQLYVREHFEAGDSSRWIDLNGQKRCLKRITVVGDTDTPRHAPFKQAKISFYGRD